jgi:hypothetical protein
VQVGFIDGTVCVINHATAENLPLNLDVEIDDDYVDESLYFPGQKVKAKPKVLKKAKWLKGGYTNQKEGIVISVSQISM